MKALVEPYTDQFLRAAVLRIEGGKVVSVNHMAVMGKAPFTAMRNGVFTHPARLAYLINFFMTKDF